ncbi:hypothetical protein EW026_g6992 [Hermanssonia centrifuga]|uniref:Uncharacterized protein n=1 Tax=Hermanssonia centrifuga TaxID=98765 RepID=A0A4V3X9K3_9APHY|nr:hypothetical protein EW026_g6992 [Hermanssonia centrifuga]
MLRVLFLLDPCIESSAEALEDVPENDMGGDTVETEMAEHFAPTPIRPEPFVAPDVPAMAVELRAQQKQKPKPAVIGGGIVKQSKPKLPTSTLTRTQTASTRKLRSQAPTEKSAGKHAVRVRAPNIRARTVRDKSPDAGKESCDMTISETSGLAAVLVAYGEKVITNTTKYVTET